MPITKTGPLAYLTDVADNLGPQEGDALTFASGEWRAGPVAGVEGVYVRRDGDTMTGGLTITASSGLKVSKAGNNLLDANTLGTNPVMSLNEGYGLAMFSAADEVNAHFRVYGAGGVEIMTTQSPALIVSRGFGEDVLAVDPTDPGALTVTADFAVIGSVTQLQVLTTTNQVRLGRTTKISETVPTTGDVLGWSGTEWRPQAAAGGGGSPFTPWRSGRFYSMFSNTYLSNRDVSNPGAGVLVACPVFIPNACTLDRLAVAISAAGAAGSISRLGLYADSNGLPGALLVDTGSFATDVTTLGTRTISYAVPGPGLYWTAFLSSTATTPSIPRGRSGQMLLGEPAPSVNPLSWLGVQRSGMSAGSALPNPFGITGISTDFVNEAYLVEVRVQ